MTYGYPNEIKSTKMIASFLPHQICHLARSASKTCCYKHAGRGVEGPRGCLQKKHGTKAFSRELPEAAFQIDDSSGSFDSPLRRNTALILALKSFSVADSRSLPKKPCHPDDCAHLRETRYFRETNSETWQRHVPTSGSSVVASTVFIAVSTRQSGPIAPHDRGGFC